MYVLKRPNGLFIANAQHKTVETPLLEHAQQFPTLAIAKAQVIGDEQPIDMGDMLKEDDYIQTQENHLEQASYDFQLVAREIVLHSNRYHVNPTLYLVPAELLNRLAVVLARSQGR